jgi:hypothetical protein
MHAQNCTRDSVPARWHTVTATKGTGCASGASQPDHQPERRSVSGTTGTGISLAGLAARAGVAG